MEAQRPLILSLIFAASLFYLPPISAGGTTTTTTNTTDFIRTSCNSTLYPELCYTSLSRFANSIQQDAAQLARVAISVSLSNARRMTVYVSNISRQADNGANPKAASALHDCFTNFGDAVEMIRDSFKQMSQLGGGQSIRFQLSNVQTWMSAALTNQETCTDGLEEVDDSAVKTDVCGRAEKVKKHTSNALALVNSYAQKGIGTP